MNLCIQRERRTPDCTLGTLELPSGLVLYTLELTWKPDPSAPGGEPNVSCVPPGFYRLALHDTPKHPQTFALVNGALGVIHEPDPDYPDARIACLIHVANYPYQLEGCIGVGMNTYDCVIAESGAALAAFKAEVPWVDGHTLTITEDEIS